MLEINSLSFAYETTSILSDINFNVAAGEHISIVGESGCGKSTLLKLIYGILQPNEGHISWQGKAILGPDFKLVPGESYMKYLSQDLDLMAFTTVEENVGQFLSVFHPEELRERTVELLEMIDMVDFARVKIEKLSGGQQQRVALARVLAQQPEILLLDEPFAHIDNFRKNRLRRNLFKYLKNKKISCITATHDYQDILPYADRILVLKDQEIMVDENTVTLYTHPKNIYTATLFGEANHIPIDVIKSYGETKRKIIVYAHEFKVSYKSGIPVIVERSYFMGSHFLVEGLSGEQIIRFHSPEYLAPQKEVFLNIALETINQRLK
ncbi:MAG TPA: ABC transporter ATP-binding protein [Arenibacter sp.]|nr:ABC transporter ATP-binding protein [Arenibacter sp.]